MLNKAFLFRNVVIVLIILVLSIAFIGEANAANVTKYQNMAGEQKFTDIKEKITHSAFSVSTYKALDAYKEITTALNDFQRINSLVKETERVDDIIGKVADGLDQIATTYEKIANFGSDISSHRNDEFSDLLDFDQESLRTEHELKEKITEIQSENRLSQRQLQFNMDDIEAKKLEVSIKGNQSIINSLEAQRLIWDRFHLAQTKLLESLDSNSKKIDLLLYILNVNASVYREAANVARLRHSAKGALDSLRSLANTQDIFSDLENSWLEVNDIVSEISKAEFVIDIE